MKLSKWMSVVMLVLLLSACGDKAYEPRDINPETDVCYICNMSVTSIFCIYHVIGGSLSFFKT